MPTVTEREKEKGSSVCEVESVRRDSLSLNGAEPNTKLGPYVVLWAYATVSPLVGPAQFEK